MADWSPGAEQGFRAAAHRRFMAFRGPYLLLMLKSIGRRGIIARENLTLTSGRNPTTPSLSLGPSNWNLAIGNWHPMAKEAANIAGLA